MLSTAMYYFAHGHKRYTSSEISPNSSRPVMPPVILCYLMVAGTWYYNYYMHIHHQAFPQIFYVNVGHVLGNKKYFCNDASPSPQFVAIVINDRSLEVISSWHPNQTDFHALK